MMERKIPKVIHYCWFGGKELPALARKCIASWRKKCPEFDIIEWNETNFDINITKYTKQAYEMKKYAFVSDYCRFYVLYNFGGIYLDVDVELVRPLNALLDCGPYIGCEQDGGLGITLNPGLGIAVWSGDLFLRQLLDDYQNMEFVYEDGSLNRTTIVEYTTELFRENGLNDVAGIQKVGDFSVYPREYFSPQHFETGSLVITSNTYSIHYYSASWFSPYEKFAKVVSQIIGATWTKRIVWIKKKILNSVRRGQR